MSARSARVVVASTRASSGVYDDRCGPIITEWLEQHGFSPVQPEVVADGEPVGEALRGALDAAGGTWAEQTEVQAGGGHDLDHPAPAPARC